MEKRIVIDYNVCMGCRTCELVCSLQHYGECNPKLSCIRVVRKEAVKEFFPTNCSQCFTPICADVCPIEAIEISDETGMAVIDSNRCIGCMTCVMHCPFGAASFNHDKGVSFKCDLCFGEPACAEFCPTGAIKYIPVEEVCDRKRRDMMDKVKKATEETIKEDTID